MVPFRKRRFFHRMLMFCVALAVGTLAGTGFMVLIPEVRKLTRLNWGRNRYVLLKFCLIKDSLFLNRIPMIK